jgi:protein phosphatase
MTRSSLSPHPYLWAVGPVAGKLTAPNVVEGRYKVILPHIWQDIYPEQRPTLPDPIPASVVPYLKLHPLRLHLPEVYGICQVGGQTVLLLHHGTIDRHGQPLPSLRSAWPTAHPLRQGEWLWQALSLWSALAHQGVAASLVDLDNLCVEGGRLRLQVLIPKSATLTDWAESWSMLLATAQEAIAPPLDNIFTILSQPNPSLPVAQTALNQLLIEQAAQLPLSIQVASATDPGAPDRVNEDRYYPTATEIKGGNHDHLLLVCDGIGGHDGGAIASQMAVQSLRLQVQALLQEIVEDPEIMAPDVVADQLATLIRITNNVICTRNDQQGREARQRMATTLTLALQLPQQIDTPDRRGTSHELYLAHVGDSRAYWITEDTCHCLTVDDDIAGREIRLGRSFPVEAWHRPDAGALTQALGTRPAEKIHPTIQRFVIDEDGILLLCSDGLSDRRLVERCWRDVVPAVLQGEMSLKAAVDFWLQLGRQRNGHDNITVVAALYRVTESAAIAPDPDPSPASTTPDFPAELNPAAWEIPSPAAPSGETTDPAALTATPAMPTPDPAIVEAVQDADDAFNPVDELRAALEEPTPPSPEPPPVATAPSPSSAPNYPFAAPPPASPPDDDIDPNLEVSDAFFEDVDDYDGEETATAPPAPMRNMPRPSRQLLLWSSGVAIVVVVITAIVMVMQGQFNRTVEPTPPAPVESEE